LRNPPETILTRQLRVLELIERSLAELRESRIRERLRCAELALSEMQILDLRVSPSGDLDIRFGQERRRP
jgi:hypothetical protein